MEADSEHALVERAKTGDRAAFAALVDRYWNPLCRWLIGLTGKTHTAEDLTQEAFVRAWSALPMLKEQLAFRVWLFRIAHNAMLLQQRGPRGAKAQPLDPEVPDLGISPVMAAIEGEASEALREAIQRLPESYRAAYLLWSQENVPYVEIARILSITEENARWRVHEARRMLVKVLHAHLRSTP